MDDDMPPRRRNPNTAVIDALQERGLAMRILLHSPKDMIAGALAFAAIGAIVANTMFMQTGHHPAPMYGAVAVETSAPVSPLPRPRPAELAAKPAELKAADVRVSEPKAVETKAADPLAHLVKTAPSAAASNVARPPAPIPVSSRHDPLGELITTSRRVASVQRALTEYGYGQLKPTGTIGADTQAAIQKFERDRKIPVTGQMSDRLVRELTAMIGHPID
jgi:Putative peptidoglycan binding domain